MTTDGPIEMTRAARRALAARTPAVDLTAPPCRPRPLVVTAAVVTGLVVAVAALLDSRATLLGTFTVLGLLVAAGWPRLVRAATPAGSSVVLGVTTVALTAALALRDTDPLLDHVPVALALGVVAMCLHPLISPRAREDLAGTLVGSALGIAVLTAGAVLVTTPEGYRTPLLVGGVAIAVAALPDLLTEKPRTEPWMLPVGIFVGGLAGLVTEAVSGGAVVAWAALVGMLGAGIALSLRRVLAQSRAVDSVAGGIASGVASVLVSGPAVHLLARAFLG